MDELITELELLNTNILNKLSESSYEEMVEFVDKRGVIIKHIQEQISESSINTAQKERIVALTDKDGVILSHMNLLRLEAQDWLLKRNQAKTQRNAYEIGYAPDSILMDRRK